MRLDLIDGLPVRMPLACVRELGGRLPFHDVHDVNLHGPRLADKNFLSLEGIKATMLNFRARVVVPTLLAILLGGAESFGQSDWSAGEVIDACRMAVDSFVAVECHASLLKDAKTRIDGGDYSPGGLLIQSEYQFAWDRSSGGVMVRGRELGLRDNVGRYQTIWGAFSGVELHTLSEEQNKGQIIPYQFELAGYLSIPQLLGYPVTRSPERSLVDLLAETGEVRVVPDAQAEADGVYTIEKDFLQQEGKPRESRHLLVVEIDSRHGYLPRSITTRKFPRGGDHLLPVDDVRVEVTQFARVEVEWWVPAEGRRTLYNMYPVLPDGVTMEQWLDPKWKKQDPATFERVRKEVQYRAIPIGEEIICRVDPDSVDLSGEIPKERFRIDFPKGALVYNGFTDKPMRVGMPLNPEREELKSTPARTSWSMYLLIMNALVL